MDKNILKTVIADNQAEVLKYQVIPRDFTFEEFGNYVFVGIRKQENPICFTSGYSNCLFRA